MIRTAHPVSAGSQIRLRLEQVTRRARQILFERCRVLRERSVTSPRTAEPAENTYAAYLRRREACLRAEAVYNSFEPHWDELTGVLCLAAHEGVTPEFERTYQRERGWFMQHYLAVKPYVAPYLLSDDSDTVPGRWGTRVCDAFEALFLPGNLTALLEADNGHLIHRLTRTQNAAVTWHNTLRTEEKSLLSGR